LSDGERGRGFLAQDGLPGAVVAAGAQRARQRGGRGRRCGGGWREQAGGPFDGRWDEGVSEGYCQTHVGLQTRA